MEGQAEQTLLQERRHGVPCPVQERLGLHRSIRIDDLDRAASFNDEYPTAAVLWRGNVHRLSKFTTHPDELNLRVPGEVSPGLCNLRGIKRVLAR